MKTTVLLLAVLLTIGCVNNQSPGTGGATNNQNASSQVKTMSNYAIVETTKGTFEFKLYDETPVTTKNFIDLANSGFYNGLTFHRYEPGFVIQGGDPRGDGTGGSSKNIPLEIAPGKNFAKGAIGMARSNAPDSASSQWFVTLENSFFLDGQYAVFGTVTKGMDVVLQLRAGDKMNKVSIIQK